MSSEVIKRQSDVISEGGPPSPRGDQMSSDAIRRHQTLIRRHQWKSDVIQRNQTSSVAIHLLPHARGHLDELLTRLIAHRYPSCMRFEARALNHLPVRSADTSEGTASEHSCEHSNR